MEEEILQDKLRAGTDPERFGQVGTLPIDEVIGKIAGAKVEVDGRGPRQEFLSRKPGFRPAS
jgi:hypothetical protein